MLKMLIPLILLLAASPALAIDQAYIGAWTAEPGRCDFSGFGPMRITAKGLEEHETDCRTTRARREKGGWSVQLACANEGREDGISLHWRLLPNGHLKETTKTETKDYVRCH